MIVVLPFCHKDASLAAKVVSWARQLDGSTPFKVLLVHDSDVSSRDVDAVRAQADSYFSHVDEFVCSRWPGRNRAWPYPQNHQWQEAAGYIFVNRIQEPWFWWEPDATPLKPDWLVSIATEHERGGKPFTGHIVGEPYGHMTGVGVYPWCVPSYSQSAMSASDIPFDLASKREVIPHCHRANHLIQHIWEHNGKPFHFKSRAEADGVLLPSAVVFHRCKDGSLIDVLRRNPIMAAANRIVNMVASVAVKRKEEEARSETAMIQLCRNGDIISVLPIARHLALKDGAPIDFYAHSDYCGLLDGVSYARAVPVLTDMTDPVGVENQVKLDHKTVIRTQVYGGGARDAELYDSFLTQMWNNAGMVDHWDELPLIFDRRDLRREEELCRQHIQSPARIALALSGYSSPLDAEVSRSLKERIESAYGASVIDMSKVKAQRLQDCLGILSKADCLVAMDSALLHLGYACRIPTVALVSDKPSPWYGSRRRRHWVSDYRYSIIQLCMDSIMRDIEACLQQHSKRFIHVYSEYQGSEEDERRKAIAKKSWEQAYASGRWIACPVPDSSLKKMFKDGTRQLPFVHDVLNAGLEVASRNDVIVYTNSDICFSPTISSKLQRFFHSHNGGYSYRRDFDRLDGLKTESEIAHGAPYSGTDLFAVKAEWWRGKKDWFPDFILGAEAWDWCMRVYIDSQHGEACNIGDVIYHERHESEWLKHRDRESNRHSRRIARVFLEQMGAYHGEFERFYGKAA
jgi:hypothetical protein